MLGINQSKEQGVQIMSDTFVASVQYGDFRGTFAADGGDGPAVEELKEIANVPAGFFVIGFSLCRLNPIEDWEPSSRDVAGMIPISVIAAKESEVAPNMQQIVAYTEQNENLPVYSFDGYLKPEDFGRLFKRVSIKVLNKYINPEHVRIVGDREDATQD
jgi:hypothetical protein